MQFGTIFDIKRYAVHDGPGIRTTVFFKGCPLHCVWCHNPEGQSGRMEILIRNSRCLKECQECIIHCPQKAIARVGKKIAIDRNKCLCCGTCAENCPAQAIERVGRRISVQEAMTEIEKDQVFHKESGGGVTFSGGEPLLQPGFLSGILDQCQAKGLHTTVDTSGFAPLKVLEKIVDKVDLFLYDLKVMDERMHLKFTGVSNKKILENLKTLSREKSNIVIRIPVIQGVNDSQENIQKTAAFILSLKRPLSVMLLPYHNLGKEKYRRLGKADSFQDFKPSSKNRLCEIQEKLASYGICVSTRN
ncbi:MAG: glycyl-radical enzyme activating protein [Candidatus Aminicenantales bacterium]